MKNTSYYFLSQFISYLTGQDRSRHTIINTETNLACFFRWFNETNGYIPEPKDITSVDLREYQSHLRKRHAPSTTNTFFAVLKSFLRWSEREGFVKKIPDFPRRIPIQKGAPQALDRTEQNRLLRVAERQGKTRDLAILRVLLSCGLRVSELTSLKETDLDFGERHGFLVVRSGKGNKYREVPVPAEARNAVQTWLKEKGKRYPETEWLFCNKNGEQMTTRYIQQIIKNYGRFADVKVHPHTLRHTAATNMLNVDKDLVAVAQIMGHSSLTTTALYTRPNKQRIMEIAAKGEI